MNAEQKHISLLHSIIRDTRNSPTTHPYDATYIERTIADLSDAITEATRITLKFDTKDFHIEVIPEKSLGWFEHHTEGEEFGGGLWFDGKALTDYDGVFELPRQVVTALQGAGYDMTYVTEGEDGPGQMYAMMPPVVQNND